MTTRSWIRNLFARTPRTVRKAPARSRPCLEGLEDRVTPSTFIVTSLADNGSAGTLRQAINLANAQPGGDTITFAPALAGGSLILADTQLPVITDDLQIDGLAADLASSITIGSSTRILETAASVRVDIAELGLLGSADNGGAIYNRGTMTVTDCSLNATASQSGGAIYNTGTLTVDHTRFLVSSASQSGGAIYNTGTLTVDRSTLSQNTVLPSGASLGGGIYNGGTLTVDASTLSQNTALLGGGIFSDGTLTVTNGSTLSRNTAWEAGGGLYNRGFFSGGTPAMVAGSILSENLAEDGAGIFNGATLTVTGGTTLSGNTASMSGGGIYNTGTLTVTDGSTLSGNSASSSTDGGGGIFSLGALTVSGSTLSGNSASNFGGGILGAGTLMVTEGSVLSGNTASSGGGIYNGGTLAVTDSTLSGNYAEDGGGGILCEGTLTLDRSTLSGNSAGRRAPSDASGGAIWGSTTAVMTVTESLFSGNFAFKTGGGIRTLGELTVTGSTFSGNTAFTGSGGAIATGQTFDRRILSTTAVIGSTFSGNSATNATGGALGNELNGVVTVTGSTFSGNSAFTAGGAIVNSGTMTVDSSTLSGNVHFAEFGDGGSISNTRSLTLTNSIVANSTGGANGAISHFFFQTPGSFTASHNLIEDGSGGQGIFIDRNFNASPIDLSAGMTNTITGDPMLGPLADNGGPTQTMALLPGSPALNAGNNALIPAGVTTDQRGSGFDRVRAGTVDIGAFEVQNDWPTISRTIPDAVTVNEGTTAVSSSGFNDPQGRDSVTVTASLGTVTQHNTLGYWLWSYTPTDGPAGPTTVTVTATDDYGLTATTTFTLTVNNVAPTAAITGAPASGHSPVGTAISLGSSVTDPSTVDTAAGFTYAWSVTKNGAAYDSGSAADFSFTPDDHGTYVVTLTATDKDGGTSPVAQTTIEVDNVAPTVVVPAAQTAYEDVDKPISGITVGDPDGDNLTVTLTVSHGTLTLGTTTGLTVSGNGSGAVTLSGSIADLNAALAGLVYLGSLNYSGTDTLNVTTSDGSLSTSGSVAITVKSAAQQVADLEAHVNALVASGVLTSGQGEALNLNLRDNNGDTGKVQAFLNQVAGFLNGGILTQAEADVLAGHGNILMLGVTRR